MESEIVWKRNLSLMIYFSLTYIGFFIAIFAAIFILVFFIIYAIIIISYRVRNSIFYYSITKKGIHLKYPGKVKTVYWKDVQDIGDINIGRFGIVKVTGLIIKNGDDISLHDLYPDVTRKIKKEFNSYNRKMLRKGSM
jgi:hypothetical protein